MASPESKVHQIYQRYVQYDEDEMKTNMAAAVNIVNAFKYFLYEKSRIEVAVKTQGSSFEGIKVGDAGEFDFLLVFDYDSSLNPREVRNAPGERTFREQYAGYWEVVCDSPDPFCVERIQGRRAERLLSTRLFKLKFQSYINQFGYEIRNGEYIFENVSRVTDASIGRTALTLKVYTDTGGNFSIDMSICIRIKPGWFSSERYFIAKEHASDRSETFWLEMNSQKELAFFSTVPESIKVNYRITKFLLEPGTQNTYVIKTAFMYVYRNESNRTLTNFQTFLTKIIEKLRDAYGAGKLGAYHNQEENLLARYSEGSLQNKYGYFRRLCNKSFDLVVDELIEHAVPSLYVRESIEDEARKEDEANNSWCVVM